MNKNNYKVNEPETEELRQVQKLENEKWVDIRLKEAEIGDVIRFIEPDGEIVKNDYGGENWEVRGKPFRHEKDGRWTALCKSIKD